MNGCDARIFDIYIPAVSHHTPFRYEQCEEAYRHFSPNVGFDPAVVPLHVTPRAQNAV